MVHTIHQFKQEMKSWAAFHRVTASKPRVENQRSQMVEKRYRWKQETETSFTVAMSTLIKSLIREAISSSQMEGIKSAQDLLYGAKKLRKKLNIRQVALLKHALSHPNFIYSINEYQNSYGIAYETARKDLMQMSDVFSFLKKLKDGRAFVFISPSDLKERIESQKR